MVICRDKFSNCKGLTGILFMRERKALAYIPVKEKSVRLSRENIPPFGGTNLLTYKIGS